MTGSPRLVNADSPHVTHRLLGEELYSTRNGPITTWQLGQEHWDRGNHKMTQEIFFPNSISPGGMTCRAHGEGRGQTHGAVVLLPHPGLQPHTPGGQRSELNRKHCAPYSHKYYREREREIEREREEREQEGERGEKEKVLVQEPGAGLWRRDGRKMT